MSQFFISCKESRIENNKSFYGCFYLGPFEPSQSITIANALRRTLLSELYGLGIVSVEIEGASHEYSSLPGVKDSVLDILLNLKEIVLKKTVKNFKPQIGYLRVRGPGVVLASHLRLPPFIQCVDPDQYIATLADNGFLNMKFIIQYGNKWCAHSSASLPPFYKPIPIPPPSSIPPAIPFPPTGEKVGGKGMAGGIEGGLEMGNKLMNGQEGKMKAGFFSEGGKGINEAQKKRRLILKKLKQINIPSNSYINMFSQSAIFLSKYPKNREPLLFTQRTPEVNDPSGSLQRGLGKSDTLRKPPGINKDSVPSGNVYRKKYLLGTFPAINLKKISIDSLKGALSPWEKKRLSKSIEKDYSSILSKGRNLANKVIKGNNHYPLSGSLSSNSSPQAPFSPPTPRRGDEGKRGKEGYKKIILSNSNPLTIDAVFNPINKVNYIIEINDLKTVPEKIETSFETSELYEILKNTKLIQTTGVFDPAKKRDTDLKS